MSPKPRRSLPTWPASRFDIAPDHALLERLINDMKLRGGDLAPAHWWMLPTELEQGTMEQMLDAWCGTVGKLPLSDPALVAETSGDPALLQSLLDLAQSISEPNLFEDADSAELGRRNWRMLDLLSVIDVSLVSAFCELPATGARVLEVGGGFGRIAEFLTLSGYERLRYVNVDAVPVSLMYSYLYLRCRFPEKSVAVYFPENRPLDDVDFLIVPAWHSAAALTPHYDLSMNIESFQEMSQSLVDYYLDVFDKMTGDNGFIYLVNSRVYKFKGEWRFRPNWECMFRHQTARSWSSNHPTEVFRKRSRNVEHIDRIRQYMFDREIARS